MKNYARALAILWLVPLLVLGFVFGQPDNADTHIAVHGTTTSAASNYSGLEIEIPATLKGIWVDWIGNLDVSFIECRIDAATIRTTAVATVTALVTGGIGASQLTTIREVRTTTATGNAALVVFDFGTGESTLRFDPPLWIPGGNFFSCWDGGINSTADLQMIYREARP